MKKVAAALLIITLFAGCKKAIEKKKEDILVKAMTDGQWVVSNFTLNSVSHTTDFTGYKFQYYSNRTVDAIKDGSVEKTGTWDGDVNAKTTSAQFTNAVNPLSLINGSWHIDDSGWTYVVATQTVGTDVKNMRLDKL
jgi:hypothetical protein